MPDLRLEADAVARLQASGASALGIAGVDEVGRGPWAGPVTGGAAWIDPEHLPEDLANALEDSKKLSVKKRDQLAARMLEAAAQDPAPLLVCTGSASVAEIDQLNILQAAFLAMARALEALQAQLAVRRPDVRLGHVLVDGRAVPPWALPCQAVIGGDGKSLSIAAASILAKVTRDAEMAALAQAHPGYGWERNAGYGTAEHRKALDLLGTTPHHRRSFKPIRALSDQIGSF
ncbi:MAG: ribonuclease HII [Rhodospirillaceae bacterium]